MSRRVPVWFLLLALSGCAAPPPRDVPDDVPDPSRVQRVAGDGFRVWIDRGCLDGRGTDELLAELTTARRRLLEILGPHRNPADFRPQGVPAEACPTPPPVPSWIDVVVVRDSEDGRCHADADGICVLRRHLRRKDATHELVHYLAGSSWRPIDEGLAVHLTERLWGPDKGYSVKVRARAYLSLSLRADLVPKTVAKGMSRRDYDIAGAFVAWLIDAYGWERFQRLYRGPRGNYRPVYGLDETELWDRFWRYIGNLDVRHDGSYHAFKAMLGEPDGR